MQWLLLGDRVVRCEDAARTLTQHDCVARASTARSTTARDLAQFLNIRLFIIHIVVPTNCTHTAKHCSIQAAPHAAYLPALVLHAMHKERFCQSAISSHDWHVIDVR